jgi:hypothetical protein
MEVTWARGPIQQGKPTETYSRHTPHPQCISTNRRCAHRISSGGRVRELAGIAGLAKGFRAVGNAQPPVSKRLSERDFRFRARAAASVGVVVGVLVPCDCTDSLLQRIPHPPHTSTPAHPRTPTHRHHHHKSRSNLLRHRHFAKDAVQRFKRC